MATTTTVTAGYENSKPREVDDALALVAYTDTPFYSSLRNGGSETNTLTEKLEDELAAAGENAHVEGADCSFEEQAAPGNIQNRMQRFEKTFSISEDLEKTKKYARKSEIKRVRGLKTKELARDIEWNTLNSTIQAGTKTVPAKMNGFFAFVPEANKYDFSDTPAETNHIEEDHLLDVMQAMYAEGAKPNTVLAPLAQKRKISDFTDKGRITVNADASSKKLTMAVNLLETDFGVVAVLPELFIEPDDVTGTKYDKIAIYEKGKIARKIFRSLEQKPLARTGDAQNFYMTTSLTILPDSTKVCGSIENLTRVKKAA